MEIHTYVVIFLLMDMAYFCSYVVPSLSRGLCTRKNCAFVFPFPTSPYDICTCILWTWVVYHQELFITIWDPPIHPFINFSNISRQNHVWIFFTCPQHSTPFVFASSYVLTPLNHTSSKKMPLYVSLPYPLVSFMDIFVQACVPPIYCFYSNLFVASFPFCVSRYNIVPNIEHSAFFNFLPNVSGFMNIKISVPYRI